MNLKNMGIVIEEEGTKEEEPQPAKKECPYNIALGQLRGKPHPNPKNTNIITYALIVVEL